MKVLLLGWEYPPFHSGGLGIASRNLALSLARQGVDVSFALPSFIFKKIKDQVGPVPFDFASYVEGNIEITEIPSTLSSPYLNEKSYRMIIEKLGETNVAKTVYGKNLYEEIERYAQEMERFVRKRKFDLVHAHDWITYPAAQRVKECLDIPLVTHVHSTEYDRTGGNLHHGSYSYEKDGMEAADRVIAVSNYTKSILQDHYQIEGDKVSVVHNGVETDFVPQNKAKFKDGRKKVLFLGRLTLQKGPDWFIQIAKRVLEVEKEVDFLIAGKGDMLPQLLFQTIQEDLKDHIHFLGFINEVEREKAFAASDVYVLSSVSEPFGLSAVEAAQRGVPVVLSKQSGVREVLYHSLSADYWDVDKMANYVLSLLKFPSLSRMLSQRAFNDIKPLTWDAQSAKVQSIYCELAG